MVNEFTSTTGPIEINTFISTVIGTPENLSQNS